MGTGVIVSTHTAVRQRDIDRTEIQRQTEEFLASGGRIRTLPVGDYREHVPAIQNNSQRALRRRQER